MTKIKNVTIEFNCPESIADNLFCSKCSHQLIDFTKKTEREFKDILESSNGKVCGLFKKSQLSDRFLKYAAASVIATSVMTIPVFGQDPIRADSLLKACEKVEAENEDVIFGMVVETQAIPIGGYKVFFEKVASMVKYPDGLTTKGKVFIEFSIDTLGQMKDVRLIKGFNEFADKEALRVMSTINHPFEPGRQRGKPVRTRLVVPIIFDPKKD
jgi:TonB family protein